MRNVENQSRPWYRSRRLSANSLWSARPRPQIRAATRQVAAFLLRATTEIVHPAVQWLPRNFGTEIDYGHRLRLYLVLEKRRAHPGRATHGRDDDVSPDEVGADRDLNGFVIIVNMVTKLRERLIEERTLEPGESTQFGAPFNAITQRPRLDVRIEVPSHVKNQVEHGDTLLGKREEPAKAYRVFRVKNKSSWPAFVRFVEYIEG